MNELDPILDKVQNKILKNNYGHTYSVTQQRMRAGWFVRE